ncbi:MAG TPA: DUF2225 domain-containing protein, partial [Chloroflexota bacterium]|nr:DUF2225 domain-containing protein [Chloroflexota bacterium]
MSQHRPTSLAGNTGLDLRWLVGGQVLCREGDAPGPMYVVCAGAVRVYRRDPEAPERTIELAKLGPGSIIGELAPLLNQPRSASVEAVEATQILEVPVRQLGSLAKRQTPLLRVIAHALSERAGLSATQINELATRIGLDLPVDSLPGASSTESKRHLPAPEHDRAVVYPKEVTCPACETTFSALIFRPHKDQPAERSSDFHQVYRTQNPYDYEIWVCPTDLYAAMPAEFSALTDAQRAAVAEVVDQVVLSEWQGERPDFNVDRSLPMREKALQLALAIYRMRGASPLRLAAVLHRLAWCARENGDAEREQEYMALALGCYQRGYEDSDLGG